MARMRTVHRCTECGAISPQWVGRCPGCDAWGTLEEEQEAPAARSGGPLRTLGSLGAAEGGPAAPVRIGDVDLEGTRPLPTGVEELDRLLGGGLLPGSVTLVGGEPGIGKSTLLLQAAGAMATAGRRTLVVSAEESASQVGRRADRLRLDPEELWLVSETTLAGVVAAVERVKAEVVVVDSIQTLWDPELESVPGSVSQVRGCAHALAGLARRTGAAVVLVGHVTKDGALAGPRVLEHLVDTVISFEGDRHHALRLVRTVKHRFGGTGELGLFEMTAAGLLGVPDPSGLFLGDRQPGTPGSVVFPAMEGYRPLLVEVQALVSAEPSPMARRSVTGLDGGRLAMLLAVLSRRAGIHLSGHDVYLSVIGGVRIADPGADLAVCLALASVVWDRPVPDDLVAVGEVGLGGELRQVAHTPRRLAEADRLGFRRAAVPRLALSEGTGVLAEATAVLRIVRETPEPPAPGPGGIEPIRATTLSGALTAILR